MSKNVTALSAQELIDQTTGPIYVLNNTEASIGQGGDVFVTVNQNGQNRSLQVPLTWLPVEVTRMIPRKYIVDSSYFLEALGKGLLIAISAEDAQKILSQPAAAREQARLRSAEEAVKAAMSAKGISRNVRVTNSDNQDADDQPTQKPKKAGQVLKAGVNVASLDEVDEEPAGEVSANFKAWVNKLNAMPDEDDAMNTLRLKSELSMDECQYLIDNCTHSRIANGLKRKLEKLN